MHTFQWKKRKDLSQLLSTLLFGAIAFKSGKCEVNSIHCAQSLPFNGFFSFSARLDPLNFVFIFFTCQRSPFYSATTQQQHDI